MLASSAKASTDVSANIDLEKKRGLFVCVCVVREPWRGLTVAFLSCRSDS